MAAAIPLYDAPPPIGYRTVELGRAYAEHLRAEQPEYFASLRMTVEEFAEEFAAPGLTLEQSVEAGWISDAERRYIEGRATPEDLRELGHTEEEAREILDKQRARACASSS